MVDREYLLDDQAMHRFITDGVVSLKPDLSASLFERMHEQTLAAVTEKSNPGDNVPDEVPATREILDHPLVCGALTSILGPTYRMSAHCHIHLMPPAPPGSGPGWHMTDEYPLHKDGRNFGALQARHRCREAMIMFFPGDCTADMGPTMVAPGSQYYAQADNVVRLDTFQTGGEAGTISIIHYDMWHGGTCNYSLKKRFMIKFLVERMDEPDEPTWNCADHAWRCPSQGPSARHHPHLWRAMWDWYCGRPHRTDQSGTGKANGRVSRLIEDLRHEDEVVCLNSAYELAQMGEPVVPALLDKLVEESACSPHCPINRGQFMGGNPAEIYYSGFALAAIGAPAVAGLVELLEHEDWWVRSSAANTLLESGAPAAAAAPALCRALQDESPEVRVHAATALGTIRPPADTVASTLIDGLKQKAGSGKQFHRARVAMAGALARNLPNADIALPAFTDALQDEQRIVRYYAVVGLDRLATPEARRTLDGFFADHPNERYDAA